MFGCIDFDDLIKDGCSEGLIASMFNIKQQHKKSSYLRLALTNSTINNINKLYSSQPIEWWLASPSEEIDYSEELCFLDVERTDTIL